MKERNPYLDNAKFLLISLVVIGHFIGIWITQNNYLYSLDLFIFSFHMPAFIIICGYNTKLDDKFNSRTIRFLLYYVVFDLLYAGFNYYLYGNFEYMPVLLKPHWIMWFLISIVTWRILLRPMLKIRYNLIWAILLGGLVGYIPVDGLILSLFRSIVFFPFFLIGYYLQISNFKIPQQKIYTHLSWIILIIICVIIYDYHDKTMLMRLLWGSGNYYYVGIAKWYAGIYRIAGYLLSGICCVCFFLVVSTKQVTFTSLGKYTLYIYLAHGFIIIFIKYLLI